MINGPFTGKTETSEGVDASITISIGRGDILHKPRVMWIKDRRSDTIKCYQLDLIQALCRCCCCVERIGKGEME